MSRAPPVGPSDPIGRISRTEPVVWSSALSQIPATPSPTSCSFCHNRLGRQTRAARVKCKSGFPLPSLTPSVVGVPPRHFLFLPVLEMKCSLCRPFGLFELPAFFRVITFVFCAALYKAFVWAFFFQLFPVCYQFSLPRRKTTTLFLTSLPLFGSSHCKFSLRPGYFFPLFVWPKPDRSDVLGSFSGPAGRF